MVQYLEHLEHSFFYFSFRNTLNIVDISHEKLHGETLAEVLCKNIHVELIVDKFTLLV